MQSQKDIAVTILISFFTGSLLLTVFSLHRWKRFWGNSRWNLTGCSPWTIYWDRQSRMPSLCCFHVELHFKLQFYEHFIFSTSFISSLSLSMFQSWNSSCSLHLRWRTVIQKSSAQVRILQLFSFPTSWWGQQTHRWLPHKRMSKQEGPTTPQTLSSTAIAPSVRP